MEKEIAQRRERFNANRHKAVNQRLKSGLKKQMKAKKWLRKKRWRSKKSLKRRGKLDLSAGFSTKAPPMPTLFPAPTLPKRAEVMKLRWEKSSIFGQASTRPRTLMKIDRK